MVTRILAALCCVLAACGFDERELGDRRCSGDQNCRPDEACISGACIQRGCTMATDCGTGHEFECAAGRCLVRSCSQLADCSIGFDCAQSRCVSACVDHD